jgi:hypothetical protein
MKKFFSIVLSLIFTTIPLFSQTIDSRGKDFWITFLPNYHNYKYHSNQLFRLSDSIYIFIASDKPTRGKIEYFDVLGNPYTVNFTINNPDELYIFKVPFNDYELLGFNDMATEWRQNMDEIPVKLSFHVTSEDYINVYAHSQGNKSSDAFLVLPTQSLGKDYIVLAYKSDGYFLSAGGRTPSEFAIVATEDSTVVNIEPSTPTYANGSVQQTVTLNKGEVYLVQADIEANPIADLTGTIVSANKPIALFGGHQRATVPVEKFIGATSPSRDFLCEQIPPVKAWGKSAYLVPFPQPAQITRTGTDIFRVLAANDNTIVYLNGIQLTTLNRGQYYEGALQTAGTITATGPILVAQYKKTSNDGGATYISDPFMMIIPPEEQFIENCKLINIQAYEIQDNLQFTKVYQEHYITLVVPSDALTQTRIDGNLVPPSQFISIPNSNYYYVHFKVNEGKHSVNSSKPIGVYAYGYGPANSYGYIGGMYFKGRDWTPPKLVLDSSYCFKVFYKFTETDELDTWIDSLYVENARNVDFTTNFEKGKKEVTVEFNLVNPFEDGYFSLSVIDSAQNRTTINKDIFGFTLKHPSGSANRYQIVQVNASQGVPLTVALPIQNYGKSNVSISKILINNPILTYYGNLPRTINSETIDTLYFVLNEMPTSSDTIYIQIGNECIESNFVALIFYRSDCDFSEFNFKTFENPTKIIFVGNASKVQDYIQLTPPAVNKAGAIWYADLLPVVSGFRTEFSFRIRSGSNNTCFDSSIPGADGIAFLIQNFIPYAIGNYGGGIGYDGIPNSVAIEFDTYSNDSTQIENFFDPNGNHVAVQTFGQKSNSSKHQKPYTLGINRNIMPILNDGTIYYSRIVYNEKARTLEVYLDTTQEFTDPILTVREFDLSSILKLDRGYRAYLGFTSATGCAYESHELLSWYVCPNPPDPTREVENETLNADNIIYPNPVDDFAYIQTEKFPISVKLINNLGEVLLELNNSYDDKIDFRLLPAGVYFVEISNGTTNIVNKVIKLR